MEEIEGIRYVEGCLVGKKYKSGLEFNYTIALPTKSVEKYALLIEHDCINYANVKALKRLADEGNAPYTVCVAVHPAVLTLKNGEKRNMRLNSYDFFNSDFGDFLVKELIPYIVKQHGIVLDENPDLHCLSGGSSGGISAFVIALFHSDYFHRVYISSPSFLAMGRGNEVPYLIRKYETKPLKIYEELSEDEPNDYFGSSYPICLEAKNAFEFAGYDFAFKFFRSEGHCSRYNDENEAYIRFKWLWENYLNEKITPKKNSPRVAKIIKEGSTWEKCENFPEKEKIESPLSKKYTSLAYSFDKQLIYAAKKNDEIIYAYDNTNEKRFLTPIKHAVLHNVFGEKNKGAIDIAVDKTDRLYALTDIGIECVRSFGLIDAILNLPEGKPLAINVDSALYVKTDKGVYRRELNDEIINSTERKFASYYD